MKRAVEIAHASIALQEFSVSGGRNTLLLAILNASELSFYRGCDRRAERTLFPSLLQYVLIPCPVSADSLAKLRLVVHDKKPVRS